VGANAVSLTEPDRMDLLNVPLVEVTMRIRRHGIGRCDALVQLASGLNGVTPDDVASHLAAGLHDARRL